MSKKGKSSKKKASSTAVSNKSSKNKSNNYLWVWYVLGVVVLLAALFFVYKGMTGNVITGNPTRVVGSSVDTKNVFKPIVEMVSGLIESVYDVAEKPLKFALGDMDVDSSSGDISSSGMFFTKILLLIIVFSLIYSIFSFANIGILKGTTSWVISAVVSVLTIRFLSVEFIHMIIVPYTTLGVVLTATLPFILFFYFVEKGLANPQPSYIRRSAWIFFGVVFFIIYLLRVKNLPDSSFVRAIYPLTALLSLIMAFTDGTIQKSLARFNQDRAVSTSKNARISYLTNLQNQKINEFNAASSAGSLPGGYRGGSLTGVIDRRHGPSKSSENGEVAYRKDLEALSKAISTV